MVICPRVHFSDPARLRLGRGVELGLHRRRARCPTRRSGHRAGVAVPGHRRRLLPWALRALPRLDQREWARQAVLALLCQCLYLAGVFWAAAAGVPAGTSALIASPQPALVLTAAVLLDGRRVRARHLSGLAFGTTGVALPAIGDLSAGLSIPALLPP